MTQAIAALKTLIVETLESTIIFPISQNNEFLSTQTYGAFSQLLVDLRNIAIPRRSVSVITFNYDIALDLAVHRRGLGPDYAITASEPSPGNVHVMKLHGSLNWASRIGTGDIMPLHLRDFIAMHAIAGDEHGVRIPIRQILEPYFARNGFEVESEPVIVPPTWNKAGHYNMLSNVWATAAAHLSKARHIFVVGYSLPETDSFFRHLYALGTMGGDPLLAFRVYDIQESEGPVDKRFAGLLGPGARSRYKYVRAPFAEAMKDIRQFFRMPQLSEVRSRANAL